MNRSPYWLRLVSLTCVVAGAHAQLSVVGTTPSLNASNQPRNATILVDFNFPVDAASLGSFSVYGNINGPIDGALVQENGGTRLRFRPSRPFHAGEVVTYGVTNQLQAQNGQFLRQAGYVASFRVAAAPASMDLQQIGSFFAEPTHFTRIYGGQMCDIDQDDYIDMTVISENVSEVRVFKNRGDATGAFNQTAHSISSVGSTPSPNENADFNGDGNIDIVTCNTGGASFSILLGNGDGTFQPSTQYATENNPHGMAVLDVNGDGRPDVAQAISSSGDIALRVNQGGGVFAPAVFITPNAAIGGYALTAADMNNDGISDLILGGQSNGVAEVQLGNGDGTFSFGGSISTGNWLWMITAADVNNDGNMDISSANAFSNNGSMLLGDGTGDFSSYVSVPVGGHAVATDLGDINGDGLLDWVISSFGAQEWTVWRNTGNNTWAAQDSFQSNANPACCAMFDIDNDNDIDLVLFTETSDEIRVIENDPLNTSTFCYGTASACPCANAGANGHGCEHSFGFGGALLNASGRARVSADTVVLSAGGLPQAVSTLFFQGSAQAGGGAGTVFGDGLRCATGTVIRLGTKVTQNGFVQYGTPGDVPISVRGLVPAAGGTRFYQAWFRNAASFCTPDAFNLSNGVQLVWAP